MIYKEPFAITEFCDGFFCTGLQHILLSSINIHGLKQKTPFQRQMDKIVAISELLRRGYVYA